MGEGYKLFINNEGKPWAEFLDAPPNRGLVGLFLIMDLGSYVNNCEELIGETKTVIAGTQQAYIGTGNLFTVSISQAQTTISNAFEDDESYTLSTTEFLAILEEWYELIRSR